MKKIIFFLIFIQIAVCIQAQVHTKDFYDETKDIVISTMIIGKINYHSKDNWSKENDEFFNNFYHRDTTRKEKQIIEELLNYYNIEKGDSFKISLCPNNNINQMYVIHIYIDKVNYNTGGYEYTYRIDIWK